MANSTSPALLHIIQDSRFAKEDGWELDDISLCSSGNVAVSDHNYMSDKSYVSIYGSAVHNSDPGDKLTLLYCKQFTDKDYWPSLRRRCISFITPNSTEIVTCRYDKVQVIDYKRGVVLRSRKVSGETLCLSVSESQIFIGLVLSDIVNIYDNDLNEIKSIRLKGIGGNWHRDIAPAADRLYVCTAKYGRGIVYSQDSGSVLTEYTTGQDRSYACSIAVHIELGVTAVLWNQGYTGLKEIIFYRLSDNKWFLTVNVESGVYRIRISDQGKIVTGNEDTGDVKIYNLESLFSYSRLKESLVSRLERDDCEKLADFFAMGGEELKGILNNERPASILLLALEEKGIIQPSNVDRLKEAFLGLEMSPSFYHAVNMYQKRRDQITSYDRFLATLSAHLTSSVPAELCDYFHVSDEQKDSIISSQNPGLSLLLLLDEMGIIKPSDVGCLEEPFHKFRLVQALAKINEYKEILKEENRKLPSTPAHSLEGKRALFVEFLKKKIKSWYETMTPVPWKKSCQWKSTDLFVGSGLMLTDSKAKQNVQNIDEQCKLNYTEILTNEKLKSEIRIILEGDPGAGKTMLSSQLAYDWSEGKIDGADILIFLPLKIVENKTLIQAVKEFYIPRNTPLSGNDIESILASDTERICLLLDGLEEYNTRGRMRAKESSEIMKIMKKEKHSNCKVVITCRSDFAHELPECPMLKLGRFGETERNSYIEKLSPHNTDKQQKMKRIIEDNPFILDLCSVPLLFVLVVHNIESMSLSEEGQLNKVSPFMRSMILTLCSSRTGKHEVDRIQSKVFGSEKMSLGELAFNGLCKGHQQLSWQKDFMESYVGSLKVWIDSGILVLEEGLVISENEDQDISEINKGEEENKENTTNKEKIEEQRNGTQSWATKGEGKTQKSPEGDPSERPKKEKKKEREPDTSEVDSDEMLMPSTIHGIPQLPVLPEDMLTTSVGASQAGHEVSGISEIKKKKTVRRAAGQVPLTVKFLHKVIQEWFAATFFCSMMKRCKSEDQFQNYVSSQLQHISPTDLHYVLRFTSYLHPPSCHVIMNYLLRNYRKDGSVPPYIMNCICLCFNEHNAFKGPDMINIVTDVCKEVMTIKSEDNRLLQQAKSALLSYASKGGVVIEKLELKDVIFGVDKTSLTLTSGVQLGILHTVNEIEVSRWDQVLQEEDYKNMLKLLSAGALLKEVCCIFPSQPPDSLDDITLENIVSKDLKVEWHIGHIVQSLDPEKGKWMINFKKPGTSSTEIKEVSANQVPAKNEEEMQRPTTSSLRSTNAESNKYVHTKGTLKRIGSDSITGFAVPDKKAKVALEELAVSDIAQGVLQTGTVSSREGNDDVKEIPVRNVEESHFEEAVASGVEERTFTNEISGVVQGGIRQKVFQEAAFVNRVTPMSFPGETFKDATQRTFCRDASSQKAVQAYAPVLGDVPSHLTDRKSLLETNALITKNGGVLEIPNTGVTLVIPPDALPKNIKHCDIRLRIIPRQRIQEETTSFSLNSSTVVELLPDSLKFQRSVRLTLPHCLVLQDTTERKAKIFVSHHRKENPPEWEEQSHLSYHLEDTACIILLYSLCYVTFVVDDEIVKAKKLIVYTAVRNLHPQDRVAEIRVGYYLDLPDEKMKIPYEQISSFSRHSVIYALTKKGNPGGNLLCVFTVSQEKGQISVQLAAHLKAIEKDHSLAGSTKSGIVCLEQFGASMKVQMTVTKDGGKLTIPDSGVKLEVPPNAIPTHMEKCLIRMEITPSRIVEDQVTAFRSSSCTAVEISPGNISLNCPAKLTLPHCLTFKKKKERKARIFINEEKGNPSPWKEQEDLKYELKDDTCIVHLEKLCCVKFSIDKDVVKAKRIILYTAAKLVTQMDDLAEVEVGYYSDIPGERELLQLNPTLEVDSETKLLFYEKQKFALEVLLDCVIPLQWKCSVPNKNPQEIPYNVIASSIEHSHLYVLQKESDQPGSVFCQFIASQRDSHMSSEISLRIYPKQNVQFKDKEQVEQKKKHFDPMEITFQFLSRELSSEWIDVGRALGVRDSTLNQIKTDNLNRIKETIYQMLLHWKQATGTGATYEALVRALDEAERNDLAERVQKREEFSEDS